MAVTQSQRWIIDWLLHNSMLHCKNSRPEIFFTLLKMRLKFQSTLKEQYDTQWAINHEAMLLVDFSPNLSSLWSERNWHRVYFIHLMTQSFLLFIYFFSPFACCSERFTPLASNELVRRGLFAAITQIFCLFSSIWCLFFLLALASESRRGPAATCFISLHIL